MTPRPLHQRPLRRRSPSPVRRASKPGTAASAQPAPAAATVHEAARRTWHRPQARGDAAMPPQATAASSDVRGVTALVLAAVFVAVIALLSLPALRALVGQFGALPLWLVAMPAASLAALRLRDWPARRDARARARAVAGAR